MLDLAYPALAQIGDAYEIGPMPGGAGDGCLWHHWIPTLAILNREHLRLRQLDQVLADGGSFVYPLELRWEFIDCLARGIAADFLTPHIPGSVIGAARESKAIILLFFGHEARSFSFTSSPKATRRTLLLRKARHAVRSVKSILGYKPKPNAGRPADARERSAYDSVFSFVHRHSLPAGAVWFLNGNLAGQAEYRSWKQRRFGKENGPEPFEVRFVEPFSYLAQLMRQREHDVDLDVGWDAVRNSDGILFHRKTRLELRRATPASDPGPERTRVSLPPKLFLCMNRFTRDHRRTIVCHLLRRGLLKRSLVSFRDDHPERTRFDDPEFETAWQELQKRQPLIIDRDLPLDSKEYFQENFATVKAGERWPYRETCFSIVTETHFRSDTLFVSEKLWKPILHRQPFIVAGTPGSLAYLHSLGFQTFAPMIDERYDSIVKDDERMKALLDTIDTLGALDDGELASLLERVQPILEHNARHILQLKSKMAKAFGEMGFQLGRAK